MKCLIFVKFLPGGSLPPEEFFAHINAKSSWLEAVEDAESEKDGFKKMTHARSPKMAFCIADYESIEQLAIDLSIMPGAGISSVEVVPILEVMEHHHMFTDALAKRSDWQ